MTHEPHEPDQGGSERREAGHDTGESYRERYRGEGREAGADYVRASTHVAPRGGRAARPHDRMGNVGEVGSDEGYAVADVREESRTIARSDDRIHDDVCAALWDRPDVDASDVLVAVRGGEVELSGRVSSRVEKRAIEDVALGVRGVRDVHNRLRVARG